MHGNQQQGVLGMHAGYMQQRVLRSNRVFFVDQPGLFRLYFL